MTAPATTQPVQQSDRTLEVLLAAQLASDQVSDAVAAQLDIVPSVARVTASAGQLRARLQAETTRMMMARWAEVDPWSGHSVQSFVDDGWSILTAAQQQVVDLSAIEQHQLLEQVGITVDHMPSVPDDVRGLHHAADTVRIPATPVPSAAPVGAPDDSSNDDGRRRRPDRRPLQVAGHTVTRRGIQVEGAEASTAARDATRARQDLANTSRVERTVPVVRGDEVLNRPARTLRYVISTGADDVAAQKAAEERLAVIIDQNLQLARREAERAVLETAARKAKEKFLGWRRVPHPEFSLGGSCGLCIAASTRVYAAGTLRPIHTHCHCVPVAVTVDHDPAAIITEGDLGGLYNDAGGTGWDLKRTRYQVDANGELGPVLVPRKRPPGSKSDAGSAVPHTSVEPPVTLTPELARYRIEILSRALAATERGDVSYNTIGATGAARQAAMIAHYRARITAAQAFLDANP